MRADCCCPSGFEPLAIVRFLLLANPLDVIHRLADQARAPAQSLPVPFLANAARDRAMLMRQRGNAGTFATAGAATLCLLGSGEVAEDAFLPAPNMGRKAHPRRTDAVDGSCSASVCQARSC